MLMKVTLDGIIQRLSGRLFPKQIWAGMAELADALDSGSSGATRTGSSPATRTRKKTFFKKEKCLFLAKFAFAS